jgi:hypothetical protein
MRKIVIFFMLVAILDLACEKELSRTVKKEDQPEVNIDFANAEDSIGSNDSTEDLEGLSDIERNDHGIYTFGGVAGTYFGCTSSFKSSHQENLEITFGTSLTKSTTFSQSEFELLIHPGERKYGSLGSFTTFPVIDSGLVEIAYTDRHGRRWCSTQISERNGDNGVEASVKVDQNKSSFEIEDIHKVEIASETEGYRLKGKFSCTLYEVNGKGKKRLKGYFTGIVAPK